MTTVYTPPYLSLQNDVPENLATNPSFEDASGTVEVYRNLATNPSFEATSGTVEVRRNLCPNPQGTSGGTAWATSSGGTATVSYPAGGPFSSYYRVTYTSNQVATNTVSAPSQTNRFAVSAGTTYRASLYANFSRVISTSYIDILFYDAGGSVVLDSSQTVQPTVIGWTRYSSVSVAAPVGAVTAVVRLVWGTGTYLQSGDTVDVTGVLMEATSALLPYFDGGTSPDSDLTSVWTGTANASASVLTGVTLNPSPSVSQCVAIRSSLWSSSGAYSMRVIPTGSSNVSVTAVAGGTGSLTGSGVTFVAGKTYTALAKCRLAAPLTGSVNGSGRRLEAIYNGTGGTTVYVQAPNTTGEHPLSLTFTIPADATACRIRLNNGASSGNGDVWWDDFLIIEGTYSGDYFDGSLSPDPDLTAAWAGSANASASTLSGVPTDSATPTNCVSIRSAQWAKTGDYSTRLIPTGIATDTFATVAGSTGSLTGQGVTFVAGKTYTILATSRLSSAQTGTPGSSARRITATYNGTGGTTLSSTQAPNVAGATQHTLTLTVPADATNCVLKIHNGASQAAGDVWWDDLAIIAGEYTDYFPFDGSETYTTKHPISDLSISWPGTASPYGDDLSAPLGSFSFTCKTDKIMDKFNQTVSVEQVLAYGYETEVRSISSTTTGSYQVSSDFGTVDYNYPYAFLPLQVVGDSPFTTIEVTTTSGELTSIHMIESEVPELLPGTVLPGYVGNGREMLASLTQAYGLHLSDPGNPVLSQWDQEITTSPRNTEFTENLDRGEPAKFIEVVWYEGSHDTDQEVMPPDSPVISVDAGETVVTEIQTQAWISSVNQPECVDWVEADEDYYNGTSGVYVVSGNDNLPIPPDQWTGNGGSVTVEVSTDDPRILVVTVTGMTLRADLQPFRLAMSDDNTAYPALRITGEAVRSTPHTLRLPTGVDESLTKTEVGVVIDNPFLQTLEQAYALGVRTAKRYCGIVQTLSGGGEGYMVGDRVEYGDTRYVIRSGTSDVQYYDVNFNAEELTFMSDFEGVWTSSDTMQDFMDEWGNATMGQYMRSALRRGDGA